jgi:hypothetical protein
MARNTSSASFLGTFPSRGRLIQRLLLEEKLRRKR